MPTSVAIRLGVEGGAEVKRVLAETGQDGQAAFQKIAAASDAAGAAVDRQTAKFQRLAAAAREAETQARAQANINAVLGVGQGSTGSARDSASVFELQARAADEAARRTEVLSREVATLQSRFDPMAAAGARYSAALADIARAEEIGALSANKAAAARLAAVRTFEDSTQRLERAGLAQKASAQAMVNGQTIVPNRGADVAAYGDELDRLRAKYSPLFAAQREYLGQLAEIRQAVRSGALTQAEGAKAVQSTKDAFARQVTDLRAKGDGRLTSYQAQGLFYQGTDIVASAASGMSPMTILLQQGGQIAPIFAGPGSASIKGALGQASEAVTGFVSRIGFVGGAIGVVTTAAVAGTAAVVSYQNSMRETERALAGAGRASGATAMQINAAARAAAASGEVSVRQARQFSAEYASTGRVGVEMYASLARTVRDYAASTNQDAADANGDLAKAFGNPDLVRGLDTLNERLGFLDDRTRETVRRLAEQGDRLAAQRVGFDAYAAALTKASELTGTLGDKTSAFGRVFGNVWDTIGERLDKAITGGPIADRIEDLEAQLAQTESLRGRLGGLFDYRIDAPANELRGEIARLRGIQARQAQQTERAQTAQRSREIGDLVRSLDPEQAQLDKLQGTAERLRRSLSDPITFGLGPRALAETEGAFGRVSAQLRTMTEDMERFGSATIAAQVRASEFANRAATQRLNPVDRALAGRQEQYDTEVRRLGIPATGPSSTQVRADYETRIGNADARDIAGLTAARDAALRNALAREGLQNSLNLDTDTIRKETEVRAERTSASSDFISAMINVESRGNPNARNPNSTATGLGQFIDKTWLRLFPQVFPDRAAGMTPEQILSRRTDREDSIALIQALAAENRRALERADLPTNNRNQYLAWFLGSPTAVKALRADPDAPISSVASADAIAANRKVLEGRSVGQVLNWADRTINQNAPGIRNTERDAFILRSQVTATDQTTEAEARRAKVQELLSDAISRGTEIGRQFTTAQDLMAAKSDKLTDTARNERQAMLDVADAYAKASASLENSRIGKDILFDRAQLGRTASEQAVYSRLRGTGLGMDSAEAEGLRLNESIRQTQAAMSSLASMGNTLIDPLVDSTRSWSDSFLDLSKNISRAALQAALFGQGPLASLFGMQGQGGGPGGLLGSLLGAAKGSGGGGVDVGATSWMPKFADGGWTGSGARLEAAGIVHKGEYVFDQDAVRRIGLDNLRVMHRGAPGYADGGYVGRSGGFTMPSAAPAASAGGGAPTINFVTPPGMALEADGPPQRRADGSYDQVLRTVESGLAGRARNGRGPLQQAAGGAWARIG
ncbi:MULTISPECIES: phage tail length tape measure family protein [Methylobacterium]|uniref:phage tail length tape measure family protein n=1 Tax=Methylobacterium TaxID=407 RepID=UPI0013EAEBE8|nr:phage tail length tape measure family protein [Methylobacterium sp. DB0501]NGM33880.1 tail length tape measure protein [Methylobacterium sp. DB0501]